MKEVVKMKQREVLEFDLKHGLTIEFDNGDRGVVEVDGNNRYVLQTTLDGVKWRQHGISTKSRRVMACLIYVYPSEEL
jgi:uncharacterized protein YkvS